MNNDQTVPRKPGGGHSLRSNAPFGNHASPCPAGKIGKTARRHGTAKEAAPCCAGKSRALLRRRRLGRLIVVGDFSTDVAEAPPLAPRVTEAAALLADTALTWILE